MERTTDAEQWKPVIGYEGLYEVSSWGRVRSVPRTVTRSDGVVQQLRGRLLVQSVTRAGYMRVDLCREGVRRPFEVHTLVSLAFNGPRPEGMQIMHADDDPTNNRPENLSYGTQTENMRQCVDRGRTYAQKKTHCKRGHEFTPENTIIRTGRSGPGRRCKACRHETLRRYEEKRSRK